MPSGTFKRLAVAVSLSPRREALLAEAWHLAEQLGARLTVIHVGSATEHRTSHLEALMERQHLDDAHVHLVVATGPPAEAIASACRDEQIDLLLLGAVPVKSLNNKLFGTIAQHTLRKVNCSVLLMPDPSRKPMNPKEMILGTVGDETLPLWADRCLQLAQQLQLGRVHILRQDTAQVELVDKPTPLIAYRRQLVGQGLQNARACLDPFMDEADSDADHIVPEIHMKLYKGRPSKAWVDFAHRHHTAVFALEVPPSDEMGIFWRLQYPTLRRLIGQLPCRLLLVR